MADLFNDLGLVVTLETTMLPTLTLAGGGPASPLAEWLSAVLKPTIKVGGVVLYAPYGEAGE